MVKWLSSGTFPHQGRNRRVGGRGRPRGPRAGPASNAKLFSGAATAFGAEPNTQVSLVDAAMPGMLPVPNRECIRQAVRTGMALDAKINKWSRFDRKNYFYADLPQGYQISQLYHPLVGEGELEVLVDEKDEARPRRIGIERIHVEQDAGKLMHDQHATMSYVDFNRCGVALMEIVSRPDMRSPAEAGAYLRKLRSILRYVGSCDGNMEEGSMRADVNVSVRKPGGEFGTRTETKNVNSVRFVMAVVEHEAKRQVELIESGGEIAQETRLYDPDKNVTRSLRSKEDAHDYRYFPDPTCFRWSSTMRSWRSAVRRSRSCRTRSGSAMRSSA